MDNKRVPRGALVSRKGPSNIGQDKCGREGNTQFCNRVGCNGRLKYSKGSRIQCSDEMRRPSPAFRSSNGKEIVGTSSNAGAAMTLGKKPVSEFQRMLSSQLETSETNGVQGIMELPEFFHSSTQIQGAVGPEHTETESGKIELFDVGSSAESSNSRPWRMCSQKYVSGNLNISSFSSLSSISKAIGSGSSRIGSGVRCGLKNLKCNSKSDVIPQNCSPSELKRGTTERYFRGESSWNCRAKKKMGQPSYDDRLPHSKSGIYSCETRCSRRWGSGHSGTNGVTASERNKRSINVNNRCARSDRSSRISSSPSDSTSTISKRETPINLDVHISYQCSQEASSCDSSPYSCSVGVGNDLPGPGPFPSMEVGVTHFMNRDTLRQYNIDGIAEVLMELERIEQNDEITYEQLLTMETNLFLSSLNAYDQHRDMRLDIDNMSYEELLALEERMGTVSTALSEDVISKCLDRGVYQPHSLHVGNLGSLDQEDELKCSICQEEFEGGDEMGQLECEHSYHVECIEQWLRLKNWCPICKGSAASSSHSGKCLMQIKS